MIAAKAPIIATMDGDGQNDPADIMRLVGLLGPDGGEPAMVAGLREGRKAEGLPESRIALRQLDP